VLFGSVFGAILGPTLFTPMFAGRDLDADALVVPWLAAAAIPLVALALALAVRPDPKRIAELLEGERPPEHTAESLSRLLRRPGVVPAMVAAIASLAVMVSVMNLTGYVVVDHLHHHQSSVFPIIAAHVLGMYALVLFIGTLIDRVGRAPMLAGGLGIMSVSCLGLVWLETVPTTALLLFGLGVGWNISFVAATAELADRTAPSERGRLLGFNDLLSSLTGAALALLGGFALDTLGVTALAVGAAGLVVLPVAWLAARGEFGRAVPKAA
jgi:predicted MFS family arabinose efflux permease